MRSKAAAMVEIFSSFWVISIAAAAAAASFLFVPTSAVDGNHRNNPADELVSVINTNRTAHKSSKLFDNPGLGCLALQYIKAYGGKCKYVGPDGKKPADSQFAEVFAPNCGVVAKTLSPLTGRIIACQGSYLPPADAFHTLLIHSRRSLEILHSKNHTQVGVAISDSDGGAPYFWCLLFGGGNPNKTFALDGGVAKAQGAGCFSGTDDECSKASLTWNHNVELLIVMILVGLFHGFAF